MGVSNTGPTQAACVAQDKTVNSTCEDYLFTVHACLPAHVYVLHVHAWCLQRAEEGTDPLELEVQI